MYGLLLKTFLKERLSLRRLFGNRIAQSRVQSWLMIGLLVYAFGVSAVSVGVTTLSGTIGWTSPLQYHQLLKNMYAQLIGLGFLFGFFQAQGYLFQYKDFDLLGSLPIPQRMIAVSKISMMMVFLHIFSLVIILPVYVIWWWFISPPWYHVLLFIPIFFLAPLPTLLFGSFVAFLIRKITQPWLHAKTLQTILSVFFILLYFGFALLSPSNFVPDSWLIFLNQVDILSRWFFSSLSAIQILPFFGFVLIQGLILYGFITVMSQPLIRINQARNQQRIRINHRIPKHHRSLWIHLIHKEVKRFIQTPIYLMNTGFGLLLLMLLTGLVVFFPSEVNALQVSLNTSVTMANWIIFILVGFAMSTVFTPAVSLSLEGANFPLLKSLPVTGRMIFISKIFFNMLLISPFVLITGFVLGLRSGLAVGDISLLIVSMLIFGLLLSTFYMFLNIWLPRFDYQHEVEVVKQSLASVFAVFGGFAWLGLTMWLVFGLLASFSLVVQLLIVMGLHTILVGSMLSLLLTKAETYWQNLTY
jgi:ABC-2 type transport system permease protein